jgi:uncharacterized phage-associated protein
MSYSAIKIANEFLRIAKSSDRTLTPLQLIKLVYISHGWGFVFLDGSPLLDEAVQAWQYGPVVPSLYRAVRDYRAEPIARQLDGDVDMQQISPRAKEMLAAVFERYKAMSGTQLSALTHRPNTPWSITWNDRGKNAVIKNDLIAEHYRRRYQELEAEAAAVG